MEPIQLNVGTLDIETLGLKTTSVVWEVACVKFVCNEFYEYDHSQELQMNLDIFEQLEAGRYVDPEAVKVTRKHHGAAYPDYVCSPNRIPVVKALEELRAFTQGLDELWINKSSFDNSLLFNLSEQFGVRDSGDLWGHRVELDLRVLYRKLPIVPEGTVKLKMPHRAMSDCKQNIVALQQFGQWKKALNDRGCWRLA